MPKEFLRELLRPNKHLRGTQPRCMPLKSTPFGTRSSQVWRASIPEASSLAHAVFDVEPAVVACQTLLLHLGAAGLELALVGTPLGLHVLQLVGGQLHSRWLCSRGRCGGRRRGSGRGGGLGRSRVEHAGDKQRGSETNSGAKH